MNINYFYSLTPREFSNILAGYRKKEENQIITSWEQTRQLMYITALPNAKKGVNLKPQDVLKLPWDDEVKTQDNTVDPEASKAYWDKVDKHK